jgi:hypothetical protein
MYCTPNMLLRNVLYTVDGILLSLVSRRWFAADYSHSSSSLQTKGHVEFSTTPKLEIISDITEQPVIFPRSVSDIATDHFAQLSSALLRSSSETHLRHETYPGWMHCNILRHASSYSAFFCWHFLSASKTESCSQRKSNFETAQRTLSTPWWLSM